MDRVLAAGETNDFYLVANNHAMRRKGFAALLERIVLDESYFDRSRLLRGASLWLGPKGTVTSLHHDETNVLFHQVYGRNSFSSSVRTQSQRSRGRADFTRSTILSASIPRGGAPGRAFRSRASS